MRDQRFVLIILLAACAFLFRGPRPLGNALVLGESVTDLQARLGPGVSVAGPGHGTWLQYGGAAALVEDGKVVGLNGFDVNSSGLAVRRWDSRTRVRAVLGQPDASSADQDLFRRSDCQIAVVYDAKDQVKQVFISSL